MLLLLQGHLDNCDFSVCGSCQMRITTDPSEHECESHSDLSCPLSVIGCPASKFVSVYIIILYIALEFALCACAHIM